MEWRVVVYIAFNIFSRWPLSMPTIFPQTREIRNACAPHPCRKKWMHIADAIPIKCIRVEFIPACKMPPVIANVMEWKLFVRLWPSHVVPVYVLYNFFCDSPSSAGLTEFPDQINLSIVTLRPTFTFYAMRIFGATRMSEDLAANG